MDHQFTLYIAGDSDLAARALANFDRVVRARLRGGCGLTVVDVLKEPRLARLNRVIATPLLVRERPLPLLKLLGDLSQEEKLLAQLGLNEGDGPPAPAPEGAP